MNIEFVNRFFLFEAAFFVLIGLITMAIPIIRWLKWRKSQFAEGYERYSKFFDWADSHISCYLVTCLICAFAFIMSACLAGANITKAYENRVEERSRYEHTIIQHKTISDAFEKTTDIVNTDLYLKAVVRVDGRGFSSFLVKIRHYQTYMFPLFFKILLD